MLCRVLLNEAVYTSSLEILRLTSVTGRDDYSLGLSLALCRVDIPKARVPLDFSIITLTEDCFNYLYSID
jgi:hypothetical protein